MDNQERLLKDILRKVDFLYQRAKDHDRQLQEIHDKILKEEKENDS